MSNPVDPITYLQRPQHRGSVDFAAGGKDGSRQQVLLSPLNVWQTMRYRSMCVVFVYRAAVRRALADVIHELVE